MSAFRTLSDEALVGLLHTAADRLPRQAMDEMLRRGPRLLAPLSAIVVDKRSWTQPLPEWWAVVHATYLLGALESSETLIPLLTALRWADAFDCDWVTEDLPSIFGRIGTDARGPLEGAVADPTAGPGARAVALAALASVALSTDRQVDEVLHLAADLMTDPGQGLYLRQTAANLLVDFHSEEHRGPVLDFGREEAERHRADPAYEGVFYDWEVDELFGQARGASSLDYYRRDWLAFYDAEEIDRRQDRWRREQDEGLAPEGPTPLPHASRDLTSPCSCGSGRPFGDCCYLKVH